MGEFFWKSKFDTTFFFQNIFHQKKAKISTKMQNLWWYAVVNIIIKLCCCAKESFVLQFPLKKLYIKKFPGFERFFTISVIQNLSFLSLFSFYFFFFFSCKLCTLKTKYLEKHNKRQNVTWAHSFLLFAQKDSMT